MHRFILVILCMFFPVTASKSNKNKHHVQKTSTVHIGKSPAVYLFGLERSGTNFIEQYLAINFQVRLKPNPQHKHFRIFNNKNLIFPACFKNSHIINSVFDLDKLLNDASHTNRYIVIYKNPFSWLPSIERFYCASKATPAARKNFLDQYIAYRKKWQSIRNARVLLINYEELIRSWKKSSFVKKMTTFLGKKTAVKPKTLFPFRKGPRVSQLQ